MAVRDSSDRVRKRKDDVLTALCAPGIGAREGHPFRVNCCIFTSISECLEFLCILRVYVYTSLFRCSV